jgi:hypothetical protein
VRWPWRRQRREPIISPEAQEANLQGDRALEDALNLDSRVERVARDAAEIRRVNHIAAAVLKSLKGN